MKETVERLKEARQVALAKDILESHGYSVTKKRPARLKEGALINKAKNAPETSIGDELSKMIENPEAYGYYPEEDEPFILDILGDAIKSYLRTTPENVVTLSGELVDDHKFFSELDQAFHKVSDAGEAGDGAVECGTIEGQRVLRWLIYGAEPTFVFTK